MSILTLAAQPVPLFPDLNSIVWALRVVGLANKTKEDIEELIRYYEWADHIRTSSPQRIFQVRVEGRRENAEEIKQLFKKLDALKQRGKFSSPLKRNGLSLFYTLEDSKWNGQDAPTIYSTIIKVSVYASSSRQYQRRIINLLSGTKRRMENN